VLSKKLHDTEARLEHILRKSLKCPVQHTGVPKSSARTKTKLLGPMKQQKYTHALWPRNPASKVLLCSWFLQSVVEGEIDLQLAFFSDEAWFHLHGYINTQNDHYWSSWSPTLSSERWCSGVL
jgi:hypothetical protein